MKVLARTFFVVLLLVFSFTATSSADLVSRDLNVAGDGLITFDEDTGLEWLDLTVTQGMSVNASLATYSDWSAGTQDLLWTMWQNGGFFANMNNLEYDPAEYVGIYAATRDLILLLGAMPSENYSADGWYLTDSGGYAHASLAAVETTYNSPYHYYAAAQFSTITVDPSISTAITGVWLYREAAAVPLPGAFWLLGSGFAGIVALRRRRK